MSLADIHSRAYLQEVSSSELTQELEGVDHVLQEPRLMTCVASNRSDMPPCLLPYFDIRDELVAQGMIVFKSHQLVVPAALCKEMMAATHSSHIKIEVCMPILAKNDCGAQGVYSTLRCLPHSPQ